MKIGVPGSCNREKLHQKPIGVPNDYTITISIHSYVNEAS